MNERALDRLFASCGIAFVVLTLVGAGIATLGGIGRAAATGYATVTIASLGVMAAIAYRAGHGMGVQLATTLVTLNEALYVGTWFMSVFFLLAAGALSLTRMRRALGWSAIGVALLTLIGTAVSLENLGQMSSMLWFAWIVYASIAIARGKPAPARAVAVAHSA